jgi:hypothetical protein
MSVTRIVDVKAAWRKHAVLPPERAPSQVQVQVLPSSELQRSGGPEYDRRRCFEEE